jgi:hypothetical protein
MALLPSAWSEGDIAKLRQWYREREGGVLDLQGLVAHLGRSRTSVTLKASRLGLTCHHRLRGGKKNRRKHPTVAAARKAIGEAMRKRLAERGHPKGMLGRHHTPETRARIGEVHRTLWALNMNRSWPPSVATRRKMSEAQRRRIAAGTGGNIYSRCKYGKREDLGGQFFRSRWEANYARYLNLQQAKGLIASWEYEAETFWFEAIKRGVRSYTPDFKVTEKTGTVYFAEVKGWMDPKSKTKIKRMAKYHPSVRLRVVGEKEYREIERKLGAVIPGWERRDQTRGAA